MKFKSEKLKNFQIPELSQMLDSELSEIEIGDVLGNIARTRRNSFLGRFSKSDLFEILKEAGVLDELRKDGFEDFSIAVEIDDTMVSYMKLYSGGESPANLLIDLRLTENKFIPEKRYFPLDFEIPTYDMIFIEWLSLQNPRKGFAGNKPQLPGQMKPGLGLLKNCFNMMYIVGKEITKDGFMDIPDHFHGAVMYSRKFKFFNPAQEGILHAMLRDLRKYSFYDITWGMLTETVIDTYKNKPQKYEPSEQIFQVSPRMKKYYTSIAYKTVYLRYYHRKKFKLDYDEMVKRRGEILKSRSIEEL